MKGLRKFIKKHLGLSLSNYNRTRQEQIIISFYFRLKFCCSDSNRKIENFFRSHLLMMEMMFVLKSLLFCFSLTKLTFFESFDLIRFRLKKKKSIKF